MGVLQLLAAISNSEFFNVTNQIGTALANLLPDRVGNDVLKYNYTQAFLPGLITAATGLLYEPCLVSAGLTGAVVGENSCLLVACAHVCFAHASAHLLCLVSAGLTGDIVDKKACLLVARAPGPMHRCRSNHRGSSQQPLGCPISRAWPLLASQETLWVKGATCFLHAQVAPCVIKRAV